MRGTTAFNMGRTEEARLAFEHALPFFRRSGYRYREAVILSNLGSVASTQGRLLEAASRAEEALALTAQIGEREGGIISLLVLADVEMPVHRWEAAHEHLEQALELARASASAGMEAGALARLAVLALEEGDPSRALPSARQAVEVAADAPSPMDRGYASCALGYALLADGDLDGAQAAFDQGRAELASLGREDLAREAVVGLAAVALARGDAAAAAELARPVVEHVDLAGLKDMQRPAAVLLHAWRALDGAGDPAADRLLADSRAYLLDRAALIGDAAMAEGFLGKSAEAELLTQAQRRLGEPAV
jgi:tetratricopeptide (TPR) repeat protein